MKITFNIIGFPNQRNKIARNIQSTQARSLTTNELLLISSNFNNTIIHKRYLRCQKSLSLSLQALIWNECPYWGPLKSFKLHKTYVVKQPVEKHKRGSIIVRRRKQDHHATRETFSSNGNTTQKYLEKIKYKTKKKIISHLVDSIVRISHKSYCKRRS